MSLDSRGAGEVTQTRLNEITQDDHSRCLRTDCHPLPTQDRTGLGVGGEPAKEAEE